MDIKKLPDDNMQSKCFLQSFLLFRNKPLKDRNDDSTTQIMEIAKGFIHVVISQISNLSIKSIVKYINILYYISIHKSHVEKKSAKFST